MAKEGVLEALSDFEDTPRGQQKYWLTEIEAAKDMFKAWHKKADKLNDRFLGKHIGRHGADDTFKLNMFHSNVTTLRDMMYGNLPQIDVSRRYADMLDDIGRVASEAMERLLNMDMAENGAEIDTVLRYTLSDRLIGGLGCARVRYDATFETEETEFGEEQRLVSEDAPVEYYYWGDILFPWARGWADLRWIGFRNYLDRDAVADRFGDDVADNIEYKKQLRNTSEETNETDMDSAWMKAEIWEIWDKQKRQVVWVAEGYHQVLDTRDDPLGLNGFFPAPPFFIANPTSTHYFPTPDFVLAEDLYNEIDVIQTRISILTQAVKAVGVYDQSAEGVQRMFNEGVDNTLIPVDNWALFAEKGGLQGQIDWVPLMEIVGALDKLRELRSELIGLLQQVTGMSDVMRGGLDNAYEGVGQSEMKAKFGSIRIQSLQDQFARFATDLMQIKAEIIAKHFSPETIATRSNMQTSIDSDLLPAAVQLIKQPDQARIRVSIRPESVAMVDYAQLKQERTEYINALAVFMQSASPLMEADPNAKPFLLQLLQWGLAGFKGASEIEGVIDKAIEASQQETGDDKPTPEQMAMQQMQMQMQIEQQKEQMKAQLELQKIQAKAEADLQLRQIDKQADIETLLATHQAKLAEVEANMMAKLQETQAKMMADIEAERAQSHYNIQQTQAAAGAEMEKDQFTTMVELEKEAMKTSLKMQELAAASEAKIRETKAQPKGKSDG